MDLSAILQTAASMFQEKLDADGDGQVELTDIIPALQALFTNEEGDLDISGLMSNMGAGGLMSMAQSWMGDGDNEPVSPDQITQIFGEEKVSAFADQLGIDAEQATTGLSETIPGIIDQVSEGGSLMDLAGGLLGGGGGLGGIATGLAGKLFNR